MNNSRVVSRLLFLAILMLLNHSAAAAVITEPTPVSFVDRSITETQNYYAMAGIKSDGSVIAWGSPNKGGLIPAEVVTFLDGTIDAVKIYSGGFGFAVIRSDGSVVSWGQCGTITPSQDPEVNGAIKVKAVSSSLNGFAALREDGSVFFWGSAGGGAKDQCSTNTKGILSNLNGGIPAVSVFISAWSHVATRVDGSVVFWTGFDDSQVVTFPNGLTPVRVFADEALFVAIMSDGSVARISGANAPEFVPTLDGAIPVANIASNNFSHAAILSDGSVRAWSYIWPAAGGEIPADKAPLLSSGVVSITPTSTSFAALKNDGTVVNWAFDGAEVPFPTNMAGITQLVSSGNAYAALDSGGKVYTWGCLDEGASLGDTNDPSSAASFISQKPIQKLFSNTTAFAALATDGTVISWGGSACRVSGASTYKDFFKSTFEAVRSQLTNVVNVIDNYGSFVAVKSDGTFVAWGYANQEDLNSAGPEQPQTGILAFADYRTDETIVLTGTPQADQITISASGGTALGFGGPDTVIGSPNSDSLYGGAGDDSLIAGGGNDILLGEDGADSINGGDGSDILNGDTTPVASAVSTFALAAAVPASSDDSLVGGKDNDGINGGVGNDTAIYSGNRADYTVSYNSATQVFTIADKVANRDGTDTVSTVENFQFADGTKTAASLMVNVVKGTNNADTLTVLSGSNELYGLAGNDTLNGGTGGDLLDGGTGADKMTGGAGDDVYIVDNAADAVTELLNGGNDTVKTTLSSYTLPANVENLIYIGSGNFSGTGNTLSNNIYGGNGSDLLDGGIGNDVMYGGAGNDIYFFNSTADLANEDAGAGTDTVISTVTITTLGASIENLSLGGSANLNGTGNSLDNVIQGNTGANILSGGFGSDTFIGNAGNDTFYGESSSFAGNDIETISFETATRAITFSLSITSAAQVTGGAGTDRIFAISSIENLVGGSAADTLTGSAVGNRIMGNAGNDIIGGLTGPDVIVGNAGLDKIDCGADADADKIVYLLVTESPVGSNRDQVTNFKAANDKIDLSVIDANTTVISDQAFTFNGTTAKANSIWYAVSGSDIVVRGDVNGNTTADFEIQVKGITSITVTSFVL